MSLLYPDISLNNVTEITADMLKKHNVKGLVIDIDNTLTSQDGVHILPEVKKWLESIKENFDCILVSNNYHKRVSKFAKQVGLPFVHMACKPIPFLGFRKAAKMLNKKPKQLAVIGDQIFTDVLGGNLFGATTIRVEPLEITPKKAKSFKRRMEEKVMERYNKGATK